MEKKKCPGSKIRSKGMGRGLGYGQGMGPRGRWGQELMKKRPLPKQGEIIKMGMKDPKLSDLKGVLKDKR